MMQRWADYRDSLGEGVSVAPLRVGRDWDEVNSADFEGDFSAL